MRYGIVALVLLALIIIPVAAVPNTLAATAVSNNNATLNANGVAAGNYWFLWGVDPGYLTLRTANKSTAGGAVSFVLRGSPLSPSTLFYYVACDTTGCDDISNVQSFTTTAYTPNAVTTLGYAIDNLTESRFDIIQMPGAIIWPYTALMPQNRQTMFMIVVAVIMLFLYAGMWLRTRGVSTGVVLGLLTASFIFSPYSGLMLGIPAEIQGIAEGVMYASVAGVFLSLLKK